MQDLHNRKESSSGLCREIIKKIMVGCYGKTLESWSDRFGVLFNPVWGAMVETNTRLKVAKNGTMILHTSANGQDLHLSTNARVVDKSEAREALAWMDMDDEQEARAVELGLIEIVA
jgi:hypothetical protein